MGSDEQTRWEAAQDDGREADDETAEDGAGRGARLRRTVARLDTEPALLAAARRLRRRLPGDEKFGDALSIAGQTPAQVVARGVTAFTPERESLVKELGLAGLQLWQSLSEAAGRGRGERGMALLFTDLAGFSSWALSAGDAAALELLRAVGTAVETAILAHDGRVVKRLGDGVMATFLDPQGAVDAALDAQDALRDVDIDGYRPQMRAGIHWGRPRKLGGDYLGVDVNIAARIADAAKADQVLVSDPVLDRIKSDVVSTGKRKRLRAEGAPREIRVAAVSRAA